MRLTDDFCHLHVHTEYSMLDGAASLSKLVGRVSALGQPAVAMTDHGNLYGAYAFYKECNAQGVKPIIGVEAYVAPDGMRATERTRSEGGYSYGAYSHLTLLATNDDGLSNLIRLSSESFSEGFYFKPRIDLDSLARLKSGIIVGSGCLSSELNVYLGRDDGEADEYVSRMRDLFGDSFFLEVMDHGFEEERNYTKRVLELAARHRVPTLGTNDSHYVGPDDSVLHDAMLCLQTRTKLDDPKRLKFNGAGYYLKRRSELDLPKEALDNTLLVAERVEEYHFSNTTKMPKYQGDAEHDLREECWEYYYRHIGDSDVYAERLAYELDIIVRLGFADYFMVLHSVLKKAKQQNPGVERFGPGRGSAGGSLVAFCLGITRIDPVEHGLLFERFLNEHRVSLPDIDIDVDDRYRDDFLELVRQEFGNENCVQLGTIQTIAAKAALKDSARVLGYSYSTGEELVSALPRAEFGRSPALSSAKGIQDHDAYKLGLQLEGLARSPSVHAAGFVISPEPVVNTIPTWNQSGKGHPVSQWDQHAVEALGFVKFDFLGLKNLGVIDETIQLLRQTGQDFSARELVSCVPENARDRRTYDMLSAGNSIGVFQLDGSGMQGLLRRLVPQSIHDIAAVLALYRPGPMGANAHREYADRKNNRSGIQYPHEEFRDSLEGILGSTYGLIVYQEQVMQILQKVAGYDLSQADLVRKAMGKKDRDLLDSERERYEAGCKAQGYSAEAVQALWELLVPFADYSFNKSHAYAYAYISYWTAYLKANHPSEYFSALLSQEGDPKKTRTYLDELVRLNIPLLPPDVNTSNGSFTPTEKGIRYGLKAIKGIGEAVVDEITSRRPFVGWSDFLQKCSAKVLRSNTIEALIYAGATDSFGSREGLESVCGSHLETIKAEKAAARRGETPLFPNSYAIPRLDIDYSARQRDESSVLGVSISRAPIILEVPINLGSADWDYIATAVEHNPGTSALTLVCGEWSMDAGRVDEAMVRVVAPLGIRRK